MKKKYYVILGIIFTILIVGVCAITSYAFFTGSVNGNSSANVITTGNMSLLLNDSQELSVYDLLPGSRITKPFSVKNNGDVDSVYDVYLSELINTFGDKHDLVYTVVSTNGGCQTTSPVQVFDKSSSESKIVVSCPIGAGQTHDYQLIIDYVDDNTNQDDNKGRKLSFKISVNEWKEAELTALDLMINNPNLVNYNKKDKANNYRFTGENPNNYVSFNGYDAGWRVVGIFDGYVKLVYITPLTSMPLFSPGTSTLDWNNAMGINSIQSLISNDNTLVDNHGWCVSSSDGNATYQEECSAKINKKVGILSLNDIKESSSWILKHYTQTYPFWTMTGDSKDSHSVWAYGADKNTYTTDVSATTPSSYSLIPSVYIKSDAKVKGSGTIEDPYVFYYGEKPEYNYLALDELKTKMSDFSSTDGNNIYRYTGDNVINNYVSFNNERAAYRIIGMFDDSVKLIKLKKYNYVDSAQQTADRRVFGSSAEFSTSSLKTYLDSLSINSNPLVVKHDFGVGVITNTLAATYAQVMSTTVNTKVGLADIYDVNKAGWLKNFNGLVPYSWSITNNGVDVIAYGAGSTLAANPSTSEMIPSYSVFLSKDVKVRGKGTEAEPYVFVSTKENVVVNDVRDKIVPNMTDYSTDKANMYRFTGSNPNNYVKLSDDSVWRIISVEDGYVKIAKNENVGGKKWDDSNVNNWSSSTLASYLNSSSFDYYNNDLVTDYDHCITKLSSVNSLTYASVCESKWNGKIALVDVYDIAQAEWLKNIQGSFIWTLNGGTFNTNAIWISRPDGFDATGAQDTVSVIPAMYLKNNLHVSGDGTIDNPYIFSE